MCTLLCRCLYVCKQLCSWKSRGNPPPLPEFIHITAISNFWLAQWIRLESYKLWKISVKWDNLETSCAQVYCSKYGDIELGRSVVWTEISTGSWNLCTQVEHLQSLLWGYTSLILFVQALFNGLLITQVSIFNIIIMYRLIFPSILYKIPRNI